jgi:hypothetical protein
MTYQFLYRLKNLYDYISNSYYWLLAASYPRNLHEILVPTLIFNTQISQHTQLNHGVHCFAEPCRHQDDEENYTMTPVAS